MQYWLIPEEASGIRKELYTRTRESKGREHTNGS